MSQYDGVFPEVGKTSKSEFDVLSDRAFQIARKYGLQEKLRKGRALTFWDREDGREPTIRGVESISGYHGVDKADREELRQIAAEMATAEIWRVGVHGRPNPWER